MTAPILALLGEPLLELMLNLLRDPQIEPLD
jgi:hypothetical protein